MSITEILDFYTDVKKADEITSKNNELIKKALTLSKKPTIKTEEEYAQVMNAKRMFSYLDCFCFNTRHESALDVKEMENIYGKVVHKYNKKLLIKDKTHKAIAKYLAWSRYFTNSVNHTSVMIEAAKLGLLKKESFTDKHGNKNFNFFVFGLMYKVGDNTFSIDRLGREHRLSVETIGRQAIPVCIPNEELETFKSRQGDMIETIPELSKLDYVTYVGDGKGSIRAIPFPDSDRNIILSSF